MRGVCFKRQLPVYSSRQSLVAQLARLLQRDEQPHCTSIHNLLTCHVSLAHRSTVSSCMLLSAEAALRQLPDHFRGSTRGVGFYCAKSAENHTSGFIQRSGSRQRLNNAATNSNRVVPCPYFLTQVKTHKVTRPRHFFEGVTLVSALSVSPCPFASIPQWHKCFTTTQLGVFKTAQVLSGLACKARREAHPSARFYSSQKTCGG